MGDAPKYYQLNPEANDAAAAQIAASQHQDGDIPWMDWVEGLNTIRFMPPWSPKGLLALPATSHTKLPYFDKNGQLKLDGKALCIEGTFPDRKDVVCPICQVLRMLKEENLKVYVRKFTRAYSNVINRAFMDQGVKVAGVPTSVISWLTAQRKSGIVADPTDLVKGIDICITKSIEKKGTDQERTTYNSTTSPSGYGPLHADPNLVNLWLSQIRDIDGIFPFPDDAKMLKFKTSADLLLQRARQAVHQQGYSQGWTPPQQPAAPAAVPSAAPPPAAAPPAAAFVSAWTGTNCLACGSPQFTSPTGVTCANGHLGSVPVAPASPAPSVTASPVQPAAPAAPAVQPPAAAAPPAQPPGTLPGIPQHQTTMPTGGRPECVGYHKPAQQACMICAFEFECKKTTAERVAAGG